MRTLAAPAWGLWILIALFAAATGHAQTPGDPLRTLERAPSPAEGSDFATGDSSTAPADPADFGGPALESESKPGVPIGDLSFIAGVRANKINGIGLIVGLNGTGDQSQATRQQIANMMTRRDFIVSPRDINAQNAAMVVVTAELPPFAESGARINVTVSSIGDAKSIVGGTLLETQLLGQDGTVYALAQGPVIVGGFSAGGGSASVTKNHTTVGTVPGGGLVEETVGMRPIDERGQITLRLHRPDFRTARRVADAVENRFPGTAHLLDAGSIRVSIPSDLVELGPIAFIGEIQSLAVEPNVPARVVINERTGTIVIGHGVRIEPVAISQGNLTFTIEERDIASQPAPFGDGTTEILGRTEILAEEELKDIIVLEPGVDVSRIAKSLEALGVSPRDMISLFLALHDAGALHAEIVRQ